MLVQKTHALLAGMKIETTNRVKKGRNKQIFIAKNKSLNQVHASRVMWVHRMRFQIEMMCGFGLHNSRQSVFAPEKQYL